MNTQNNTENTSMLRVGTILRGIYRIDKYLASGGFSNTYVAYNTEFGEQVAVKEFFLRGVAAREEDQTSVSISNIDSAEVFNEQKEKFKKEARRLRRLHNEYHNEHIVGVYDIFEENGTAYYVMDYIDGENLRERMRRTGQPLTEHEVRLILPQVLDALRTVHQDGLWHLDLKPGNIMMDKSGNVKLIDFGASKQIDKQRGGATAHTTISFTPGYAPREQMEQNYAKFGPWTDIYALGATLYALLTNSRPPTPSDIDDDDSEDKHEALPMPPSVSDEMRDLIIRMMRTNRKRRPQSVDEIMPQETTQSTESTQNSQYNKGDNTEHTYSETEAEETQFSQSAPKTERAEETQFVNLHDTESQNAAADVETPVDEGSEEESKDSNGGKIAVVCMIIGFIVGLILIPRGCNSDSKADASMDTVDTFAVDTFAVDTAAYDTASYVTYVNNRSLTIRGMGSCNYTGQYDEYGEYPDGEGEARFSDGRYYKGSFVAGEMHGKAYFLYPNGDKFEGDFKDNKFHYGTYTVKEDGSYYKGYFSNGKPSSGTWYDKQGNVLEQVK